MSSEARRERATPTTGSKNFTTFSNLKLPSTSSLDGIALASLLTGHRDSHLGFQSDTDSYCLRTNICTLRKDGWPIDDCWHRRTTGRKARYKKYFISNENIQLLHLAFGERLKMFIKAVRND